MGVSKIPLEAFLRKAEEIAALKPRYRSGGSGADGTCDCIGLIIGAIRLAGGAWPGIHGSNYAARSETEGLGPFSGTGSLRIGDLVYKAREPEDAGYDLPDKYRKGGKSFTGDLRDYYHVGIVTSSAPLRILHMTSPGITVDTKVGAWKYRGGCMRINTSAGNAGSAAVSSDSAARLLEALAVVRRQLDLMEAVLKDAG